MFIYAFGEYLRHIKGMDIKYDISWFSNKNRNGTARELDIVKFPNVSIPSDKYFWNYDFITPPTSSILRRITGVLKYKAYCLLRNTELKLEPSLFHRDDEWISSLSSRDYVIGFFQSESYFIEIQKQIRKYYEFPANMNCFFQKYYNIIQTSNSVSLHIRRGDYLTFLDFGVLNTTYYSNALKYVRQNIPNIHVLVFSDDIKWAKTNMKELMNEKWTFVEDTSDFDDLCLMSMCKHNIIANSSFSWWGAWLNNNPTKIVVSPAQWFANPEMNKQTKDLIPALWKRI